MTPAYRIFTGLTLALLAVTWCASYYGWGLPSDASVRARSVREGSVGVRRHYGGGPGFGK